MSGSKTFSASTSNRMRDTISGVLTAADTEAFALRRDSGIEIDAVAGGSLSFSAEEELLRSRADRPRCALLCFAAARRLVGRTQEEGKSRREA